MGEPVRWQPGHWSVPGRIGLALPAAMQPHPDALAAWRSAGVEVAELPLREHGAPSSRLAEVDVLVSGNMPIDADVFGALSRARLFVRPYIGYDDVDVAAASAHDILVANTPDTVPPDVANHTLALILAGNRKLLAMDRAVRDGSWARGGRAAALARVEPIERLSELTLGLVGLGAIGRLVAERARPFGFRLIGHDPYVGADQVAHLGVELMALDGLLARADIVSIHTFLSPETRHLLDARRLALMRPSAYLVNTARGPLVEEAALVEALRSGRLAGAALDVFEEEPLPPSSPLLGLGTVLLSPHLANYSVSGVRALWLRAAGIALQVALGGLPERAVVINRELFDRLAAAPDLQGIPRHG